MRSKAFDCKKLQLERVVIAFIIERVSNSSLNEKSQKENTARYCHDDDLAGKQKGCRVIGSSDEVYVVDALAITGEERRGSLRKAAGSWQTSIDPQISEWGNPPVYRYHTLNT